MRFQDVVTILVILVIFVGVLVHSQEMREECTRDCHPRHGLMVRTNQVADKCICVDTPSGDFHD